MVQDPLPPQTGSNAYEYSFYIGVGKIFAKFQIFLTK